MSLVTDHHPAGPFEEVVDGETFRVAGNLATRFEARNQDAKSLFIAE